MTGNSARIRNIDFTGGPPAGAGASPCENFRAIIRDIVEDSHFRPVTDPQGGPYDLEMAIVDRRLVLKITSGTGAEMPVLVLSLSPYRKLIDDYFILCESFQEARKNATPSRLEAIDMGRRALHNEGASLLMERLAHKIEMDHRTARKLFTLLCVLHGRHPRYY